MLCHLGIAEAKTGHRLRSYVADEDVRFLRKLKELVATVFRFQVEYNAALIAVGLQKTWGPFQGF